MTNRKTTRRALVLSLLSLLICCSMLVGTTFAWFTDSVTSGKNVIIAGNLDVELYHSDKAVQNQKVDANTKLFDDITLWEPGVVAWENLTVANEGTLALKYQLAINFDKEQTQGEAKLSDVLKVAFIEGGLEATTREEAIAAGKTAGWGKMISFKQEGELPAATTAASENTWGVVIYWEPTNNDNLYNMNNLNQGKILDLEIGVILLATQLEAEFDSFDNTYDEGAEYVISDPALIDDGLRNAKAGDTVGLDPSVDYGTIKIDYPIAAGVTLDCNGAKTYLTIAEGTEAEELTIREYKTNGLTAGNLQAAVNVGTGADAVVIFEDCEFAPAVSNNAAVRVQEETASLTFKNCSFSGGKYALYDSGNPIAKAQFIECDFANITSWVLQFNGSDTDSVILIDGCTYENCTGGIAKVLNNPASGSTFTFTDNTITNSRGHDGKESEWLWIYSGYNISWSGNTLDGADWTPGAAQGLGK